MSIFCCGVVTGMKIVPSTRKVWEAALAEGLVADLMAAGALIGNAGCGDFDKLRFLQFGVGREFFDVVRDQCVELVGELAAGDDADDIGWFAPGDLPPIAFACQRRLLSSILGVDVPPGR